MELVNKSYCTLSANHFIWLWIRLCYVTEYTAHWLLHTNNENFIHFQVEFYIAVFQHCSYPWQKCLSHKMFEKIIQHKKEAGKGAIIYSKLAYIWHKQEYCKVSNIWHTKSGNLMFLVSFCSCLYSIRWSQVLSREWRCSWSSADRRCSNYIWMIDNLIAY